MAAATSSPAPPVTADGTKALADRLNRWEADGTLDRVLSLVEGIVGITDATTETTVANTGARLVSILGLLDQVAQDTRAREGLVLLLERIGEWKETGALDTLVTLAEGAVGVAQATTDTMIAEAGSSLIGGMRFVQGLPPWDDVEPVLRSFRESAPALPTLLAAVEVLKDRDTLEREVQAIPPVTGIFALGRTLRDPEINRGLRVMLAMMKQVGRASASTAPGRPSG